jgi:hypothetical protein
VSNIITPLKKQHMTDDEMQAQWDKLLSMRAAADASSISRRRGCTSYP